MTEEIHRDWFHRIRGKSFIHPIPSSPTQIYGFCNFVPLYEHIAKMVPSNAVLVEIGSLAGLSAAIMAYFLRQYNKQADFYTIDPLPDVRGDESIDFYGQSFDVPMYQLFIRNLKSLNLLHYVTQLRLPSVEASELFADKSVDFVFIDGDHTTEAVVSDIRAWLPKMKKNSIISGHDYDHDTVKAAVDKEFQGKYISIMETSWIVTLGAPEFSLTSRNNIMVTNLEDYDETK